MDTNRLQQQLEQIRSLEPVNDLIDTNFHRNGLCFPSEPILQAMQGYLSGRLYEPDPKGDLGARSAICRYYAQHGVKIAEDRVLLTASSSESYNLLFNNFTSPGDNILLPRPTYPLFEYLADFNHLEVRYYDLDPEREYRIDLESISAALDERTRFFVLISPSNPVGRAASRDELQAALRLVLPHGIMVITDEVFSEFMYDRKPLARPAEIAAQAGLPGLLFTLNGISKMFASPDLKLGWIAVSGEPSAADAAVEKLEIAIDMFLNCNSFSQYLLPVMFRTGSQFQERMIAQLDRNRRALIERLSAVPRIRLTVPDSGIHCIIEVVGMGDMDDEQFALELLRRKKVYVHPGYLYGIEDRLCVVVSFLRSEEALIAGLDAIAEFVRETGAAQ